MPDALKTRDVCKTCNSNLGLFVDAAFEKNWLVNNHLTELAYDFFDPNKPMGRPLRCMGDTNFCIPGMREDEICESWLGPLGEQVFWIRPKDDRLYWYSGGNPRTTKKVRTRAYFMASERTLKNPALTWYTFRDAFPQRNIRKIMYSVWEGVNPKDIGFSEPDEYDDRVLAYLRANHGSGQQQDNKFSMYIHYDLRFMAKLALGISHVLFGDDLNESTYREDLFRALWHKPGDHDPSIYCAGAFSIGDPLHKKMCGFATGVTITLLAVKEGICLVLNIRQQMEWIVLCAKQEQLSREQRESLADGRCFILFRPLQKAVELSLPELIAHNLGNSIHPELRDIEDLAGLHKDYFKEL